MTYSKFDYTGKTFQSRLGLTVLCVLKPVPQLCKYRNEMLILSGASTGARLFLLSLMAACV